MTAKGVDVRPLRQITGDSEFSEVFFDGVEIPVEQRIGPEHEGWLVANTTLANERGASFIWKEQVLHQVAMEARPCESTTRPEIVPVVLCAAAGAAVKITPTTASHTIAFIGSLLCL